jgi:hypothetical protein
MQNRYVGDVGDFGKFALLNALSAAGFALGIIWYLNESEEKNKDGKFTQYDHLASCDPELFGRLSEIRNTERSVNALQNAGLLPENVVFAKSPLPTCGSPCYSDSQRKLAGLARAEWFRAAYVQVRNANLIFLDPDNGVASLSVKPHRKNAVKYVLAEELRAILQEGKNVVVYQHQHRKGTLQEQVSSTLLRFGDFCSHGFAITFHAFTVRTYFIFPANSRHATQLRTCAEQFVAGHWGRVFKNSEKPLA